MTQLEEAYAQARLDCDKEARFNRDIQLHEIELMDKLSRIKEIMVCFHSPSASSSSETMD